MHGDSPQFKKCCFCLPLRRGLIGWGYARQILDLVAVVYWVWFSLAHMASGDLITYAIIVSFIFIDSVFLTILIIGGHKKSVKLLFTSFVYSIVWSVLFLALASYVICNQVMHIYSAWEFYTKHPSWLVDALITTSTLVGILIAQVYVILLTRSEMVKLRNQTLEMQFVNRAADGEARCVRADERATNVITVVDL